MRYMWILLLLLVPSAFATDLYTKDSLVLDLNISSEFSVIEENSRSVIKSLLVNLSFYPRDGNQQIIKKLIAEPMGDINGETIVFRWEDSIPAVPSFLVQSRVQTENAPTPVYEKVPFPLEEIPEDVLIFTQPSQTIDSDHPEIIRLASRLAEGEDDLFVVVHKIGAWTRDNVEYSLSTLTAEASQKASWVLKNREGVCDELTNLFIAMVRSLGIPARFVSGISYTDSELFDFNWGPHGWAEVYFPDVGWVSFDVTFGELGIIDPTHIVLKQDIDSQQPATRYRWSGRDVDILTQPLQFDVGIASKGKDIGESVDLDISLLRDEVGFGSYDLVEVRVENLRDYYIAEELTLSSTKFVTIFDTDQKKDVLLRPREISSVYFIVQIDENLNENYLYEMPFSIRTRSNHTDRTSLTVQKDTVAYTEDFVLSMLEGMQITDEKSYSESVSLACRSENGIVCIVSNTGNVFLSALDICLEECQTFELGIGQKKEVEFTYPQEKPGTYEVAITAKGDDVFVSESVQYSVSDEPQFSIINISLPASAFVTEEISYSFVIEKDSFTGAKNVSLILTNGLMQQEWTVDELSSTRGFSGTLPGNNLGIGKNTFDLILTYFDDEGNEYSSTQSWIVENTTPLLSLDGISYLLLDMPIRNGLLVVIISSFMFVLVVTFLFHAKKR